MLVFVFLVVSVLAALAVLNRIVNGRDSAIDPQRTMDGRASADTADIAAKGTLQGAGSQAVGGAFDGGSIGS